MRVMADHLLYCIDHMLNFNSIFPWYALIKMLIRNGAISFAAQDMYSKVN